MAETEDVASILVIGEHGSGKTSLLNTLVSDRFVENDSEYIKHPIFCETTNGSAYFLDSLEFDRDLLFTATGLILVVDITEVEQLGSIWLERLRDISLPLVLVLNKIDLVDDISLQGDMEFSFLNQVQEEVEAFTGTIHTNKVIRASAKSFQNVRDVFQAAFESVHYPVTTIYDTKAKQLRTNFKKVVARFFRVADRDRDDLLCRSELNWCQKFLSDGPGLSASELDRLIDSLRESHPRAVQEDKLSLDGFYCLFTLFVEKQKLNNIFRLLKKLGYTKGLTFQCAEEENLRPRTFQLAQPALEHIDFLFLSHAVDNKLPIQNFEKIMFPVLESPFGSRDLETIEITEKGISNVGFTSLFHALADAKPSTALTTLLQIGMPSDLPLHDYLQPKSECKLCTVIRAAILGTKNSVKRELLTTLAGNPVDNRGIRIPTRTTLVSETCLIFENIISNNRKHLERLIGETSWKKYDVILVYITDETSVNVLSELCEKFKKRKKKNRPQVLPVVHVNHEISPKLQSRIEQWQSRNGLGDPWIFQGEFDSLVSRLRKRKDVPFTPKEISRRNGIKLFEKSAIAISAALVLGVLLSKRIRGNK